MKTLFALAALAAIATLPAQALTAGDLAFTAVNADEDGWAMVALAGIDANTTVYFTDNEWTGAAFNGGESFHQWNTGASSIAAGTVIRFSSIDTSSLAASVGTLSRAGVSGSNNYGISQSEDAIYAYLGTSATAPTSFLAAITTTSFEKTATGTLAGTGLAVGDGAVALGVSSGSDYAEYSGDRSSLASFAGYKPLVSDLALWTVQGDGAYAGNVPDATAFSISAVPEPGSYALMLAGLATLGCMARRRQG